MDKAEFFVGSKPHDKSDRIIYNAKNGDLFFDHDGKGGDAKVLFAVLDDHLHLKVGDFLMIARQRSERPASPSRGAPTNPID